MYKLKCLSVIAMAIGLLSIGMSAMAEEGSAFTAADAKNFLNDMQKASFGDLSISGNSITYYSPNGTVQCQCEYEFVGKETVSFQGEEFDWYKFQLKSTEEQCSDYKYLIATKVHSHEDGMTHWHMRYGSSNFEDLMNNPKYAMWYPTLAVDGTTVEDLAHDYQEEAAMMGAIMLAVRESAVSLEDWNGKWINTGIMLEDPTMENLYDDMADAANAAMGST